MIGEGKIGRRARDKRWKTVHKRRRKNIYCNMLKSETKQYYKVKQGQTLKEIAAFFSVSAFALARENGLQAPPLAGRILKIPAARGDAYTAGEGDSPILLCGSEENYKKRNGITHVYCGMRVIL